MLAKKIAQNLWVIQSAPLRRCLDLQYQSIRLRLTENLRAWAPSGDLLDFGAGDSPYLDLFPKAWKVLRLDPFHPECEFRSLSEIPDGQRFDRILMLEVLEHLDDPVLTLRSLRKLLTPTGQLIISVPFSARVHPIPSDFCRWTPEGLEALLTSAGYLITELHVRGSDLATLTNKILYFFARRWGLNLTTAIGLMLTPVMALLLLISHRPAFLTPSKNQVASQERFPEIGIEDPLGYFIVARQSVNLHN